MKAKMPDYSDEYSIPMIGDVATVGANSPNDTARTQVGTTDPYRYCVDAPKVPNPDQMGGSGGSGKGGY